MRIDLICPYAERNAAKQLGARWDAVKKVWFIVDVEDLTPFMRWIKRNKSVEVAQINLEVAVDRITLQDFLKTYYAGGVSLTFKSAKAFGIPYPLPSGWAKTYANRTALISGLTLGKSKSGGRRGKSISISKHQESTAPAVFTPLCNCDVPPWEDCEHTDALAVAAMREMLG